MKHQLDPDSWQVSFEHGSILESPKAPSSPAGERLNEKPSPQGEADESLIVVHSNETPSTEIQVKPLQKRLSSWNACAKTAVLRK